MQRGISLAKEIFTQVKPMNFFFGAMTFLCPTLRNLLQRIMSAIGYLMLLHHVIIIAISASLDSINERLSNRTISSCSRLRRERSCFYSFSPFTQWDELLMALFYLHIEHLHVRDTTVAIMSRLNYDDLCVDADVVSDAGGTMECISARYEFLHIDIQ